MKIHFLELVKKLKLKPTQIVTFSVNAKSFNPKETRLVIYENGKAIAFSSYHKGSGHFEKLSVQKEIKKHSALKFGVEYKKEVLIDSAIII